MHLVCRVSLMLFFKYRKTIHWKSISTFVFLNRNKKAEYFLSHKHLKKKQTRKSKNNNNKKVTPPKKKTQTKKSRYKFLFYHWVKHFIKLNQPVFPNVYVIWIVYKYLIMQANGITSLSNRARTTNHY